jgi:NADPH-dependent 2,4-dienoyl-CoA reductase/sulfur reductase-like enzyme
MSAPLHRSHVQIAIVGAGPAGLSAALAAAPSGQKILVLDDNPRPGGQIWRQGPATPTAPGLRTLLDQLAAFRNVEILPVSRVIAAGDRDELCIEQAGSWVSMCRFDTLILATGARELSLPFVGWTLPGVTGAGGLQAMIKGGVPVAGERVVLAGSGPLLIAAALTAQQHGAKVVAIVEQTSPRALRRFGMGLWRHPSKLGQAGAYAWALRGVPYLHGSVLRAVHGTERVTGVHIERADGSTRDIDCDRVACGFGLVPNVQLAQALGCALRKDAVAVDADQRSSRGNVLAAGECTGVGGMELACATGTLAGLVASGQGRRAAAARRQVSRWQHFATQVGKYFALSSRARRPPPPEVLLCRCEDVAYGEVAGRIDWRDAKLHTRCGMGPCQGRVCGSAAGVLLGWDTGSPRPPWAAAKLSSLAAYEAPEGTEAR